MGAHLTGWRLSAGDEHTVFDGQQSKIATIACGGMSGRTFAESAEVARLIAAAPELLDIAERMMEVLEFAYMGAPEQPKEIAQYRAIRAKIWGKP